MPEAKDNPTYQERYARKIGRHRKPPVPKPEPKKKDEGMLSGLYRIGRKLKDSLTMGKVEERLKAASKR